MLFSLQQLQQQQDKQIWDGDQYYTNSYNFIVRSPELVPQRLRAVRELSLHSSTGDLRDNAKNHWLVLEELSQEEQKTIVDDNRYLFGSLSAV